MDYYIIADEKFLAFEWGKTLYSYLRSCSKKYNIELNKINLLNPPQTGFLFVLGVDSVWMSEVAEGIKQTDLVVVQLSGKVSDFNNRVIDISYDQKTVVERSVEVLKEKGRIRPAFFGIQKNDTSDFVKASVFLKYFSENDVYVINEGVAEAFGRFFNKLSDYDSVICANDLVAVYLLKRFKALDIKVPERLHVIGNGNLWISSHVSPSLTTSVSPWQDSRLVADVIFQLLRNEQLYSSLSSLSLILKADICCRETTGCYSSDNSTYMMYASQKAEESFCVQDEDIRKIKNLDSAFSIFSPIDTKIIREIVSGYSYEKIAEKDFLTHDSVKYHVKKIYSFLKIHSRAELCALLTENLINTDTL